MRRKDGCENYRPVVFFQIRLGDSPTDHVAATLSTDFISSTSKTRTTAAVSPSSHGSLVIFEFSESYGGWLDRLFHETNNLRMALQKSLACDFTSHAN